MQGKVDHPSKQTASDHSSRQATPVELAALLMDAVCRTTQQEEDAIEQLARILQTDAGRIASALMFLRAFAVDMALEVELGDDRRRDHILRHYSKHWEQIDEQVPGTIADLTQHLERYRDCVRQQAAEGVLPERVGAIFAIQCGNESDATDLALFGAGLFGAMYDEVARLLIEVELVLE